jgi:hypothetical protein
MSFFIVFLLSFLVCVTFVVLNAAKVDAETGTNIAPLGCGAIITALILAGIAIALIESMR